MPAPCQCCDYLTITSPEIFCEVCGWKQLDGEWSHHERECLRKARNFFERFGCSEPGCESVVRPPLAEETPPGGWCTREKRRERDCQHVLELICEAFNHVRLGNGIGLHQTEILDDYWGYKPPPGVEESLPKDTTHHWTAVKEELLDRYGSFFYFTNPEGFRYYLPAFLSASLHHWKLDGREWNSGQSLNMLIAMSQSELFSLLGPAQMEAVLAYLELRLKLSEETGDEADLGCLLAAQTTVTLQLRVFGQK